MNALSLTQRTTIWILATLMCGIFVACSDGDDDPAGSDDTSDDDDDSDDGDGDDDDDSEDSEDNGNQDPEVDLSEPRVGGFDLKISALDGAATLAGKVWDAPLPETTVWNKVDEEDGCVLYVPEFPFCDPICSDGVCTADGVCTPNPTAKYIGEATFTGIKNPDGAKKLVVEPQSASSNLYMPLVLYPPCKKGDTIGVETSGGDYKSFSIETACIGELKMAGTDEIPMESEKPLEIKWIPPADESLSRVLLDVDISHHGGPKGKIECDLPDTGSATVSASLVTQLMDFGYSGFPSVDVTRISRGATMLKHGRVELNALSMQTRALAIPGLVSCTSDDDCPDGQTCPTSLRCN